VARRLRPASGISVGLSLSIHFIFFNNHISTFNVRMEILNQILTEMMASIIDIAIVFMSTHLLIKPLRFKGIAIEKFLSLLQNLQKKNFYTVKTF
jgi:hypothetical protein